MNLLPERRGAFQTMPTQPFGQFSALLGARLHLLKRRAPRLAGSQFAFDELQVGLHLLAAGFELRQFLLQLLQMFLIARQFLAQHDEFFFLLGQVHRIRRISPTALLAQAFAALGCDTDPADNGWAFDDDDCDEAEEEESAAE